RETEMIKAYRDTWTLGVHSYLAYLKQRMIVAKELLTDSGSIFVQISDRNIHRVRAVMDEVFGAENFCASISFATTGGLSTVGLSRTGDFLLWYAKRIEELKYHQLYLEKSGVTEGDDFYRLLRFQNGATEPLSPEGLKRGGKIFGVDNFQSQGPASQPTPV